VSNVQFETELKRLREWHLSAPRPMVAAAVGGGEIDAMHVMTRVEQLPRNEYAAFVLDSAAVPAAVQDREGEAQAIGLRLQHGLEQIGREQAQAVQEAKEFVGKDDNEFKRKMEEAKENAKQKAREEIDRAYADMEKIGIAHAEAQPFLLRAAALVEKEYSELVGTIESAVGTVVGGLEKGASAVEEAAKKAAEGMQRAAEAVADALGSVFSGW